MTSVSASWRGAGRGSLRLGVRPRADEAAQRIRALAGSDLDWEYLQALAVEHGVVPLLSLRLHDLAGDVVPAERLRRLHELSKSSLFLNLSFTAELFRVLAIFRAAGIPAVPYKGPVLASQAYGDPALLVLSDLDLVLRHRPPARACALLVERGFQSEIPLAAVFSGKVPG